MKGNYSEIREIIALYGFTEYQTQDGIWHPIEEFEPVKNYLCASYTYNKHSNYIYEYNFCHCEHCQNNRAKWQIR